MHSLHLVEAQCPIICYECKGCVFCFLLITEVTAVSECKCIPDGEVPARYHNIPFCLSKLPQIQDINSAHPPNLPSDYPGLLSRVRDAKLSSPHPIRSQDPARLTNHSPDVSLQFPITPLVTRLHTASISTRDETDTFLN